MSEEYPKTKIYVSEKKKELKEKSLAEEENR